MEFSLAIFSVGLLTTVLGSIMVYLSLRREPEGAARHGYLGETLEKIKASRSLITFMLGLGAGVTLVVFAATLLGWVRW